MKHYSNDYMPRKVRGRHFSHNALTDKKDSESIGRSAALMSALVIISRITGFLRTWAQAYAVGTTLLASCYTVANNLPNQLYELVMGGMLVTAFLPVYLSVKKRLGQKGANAYISNLLSIIFVLMGLLTLVCIIFAAQLVFMQSATTDQSQMRHAVFFFRFFAIEILLYCLSSLASGVLNAEREYFWSQAAPIFNNCITIASFLVYPVLAPTQPGLALLVLALGNPLGVLVQVLVQLPSLKKRHVKIRWRVDFKDLALKETLKIGLPTLVITACTFITVSVMNTYSLYAAPEQGSSVQYYARLWYTLPYSVLSIPLTTALFTELSDRYSQGDKKGYLKIFINGLQQTLFMLIPFALYLIAFAYPLMLLFVSGSFTVQDAELTAYYLSFLAINLPFFGIATFFQKVFSSMRQMKLYAEANVVASIIQVIFTVYGTEAFGIAAVALGNVLFSVILDLISFVLAYKKLGAFELKSLLVSSLFALGLGCAGAASGSAVLYIFFPWVLLGSHGIAATFLILILCGGISLCITFGAALLLKLPQVAFLRSLLSRFFHKTAL